MATAQHPNDSTISEPDVSKDVKAVDFVITEAETEANKDASTGQDPSPQFSPTATPAPSHSSPTTDQVSAKQDKPTTSANPPAAKRKNSSTSRQTSKKVTPTPQSTRRKSKSKRKTPPGRTSLLSRFVFALIPCVGPSPHGHGKVVDVDDAEKQGFTEKEKALNESSSDQHSPEPSTSSTTTPLVQLDLDPSTLAETDDPAIIVPPTPRSHVLPESETHGLTSGAVQPPGSTGEETHVIEDEEEHLQGLTDVEEEERRLIMNGGAGIPVGPDGVPRPLLPPLAPEHVGRKCLVLDLDETLLHGSFKVIPQPDYIIPVEIEYHWHNIYALKRPGVDNFLKQMGEVYEVVVFTASLGKYANAVLDKLDVDGVITHRLFRESCFNHRGNYVKDLSQLGRPLADTIILDNSPASYIFHPNNAVPVSSWFNDPHDTELTDLCPFLADLGAVEDVRGVLDSAL